MSRYAKALVSLLTALSAWGTTAAVDGDFDLVELFGLPLVLVAGLTVFAVPNRPPRGSRRKPEISEQDPAAGHADPAGLALIVLFLLVVLLVFGLIPALR